MPNQLTISNSQAQLAQTRATKLADTLVVVDFAVAVAVATMMASTLPKVA